MKTLTFLNDDVSGVVFKETDETAVLLDRSSFRKDFQKLNVDQCLLQ